MDRIGKRREAQKDKWNREELVERLSRVLIADGRMEFYPGLTLYRWSSTLEPIHVVALPSFCVIAQGSKEIYLGNDRYRYDSNQYLLATADLPVTGRVLQASKSHPYLGLRLTLEPILVGSVLMEIAKPLARYKGDTKAISVSPLDSTLLEIMVRLARLLDTPEELRLLFTSLTRELVFRLLMGEQGHKLIQMTSLDGHTNRIVQAIGTLRREFNHSLPIESLAKKARMSVSGFHRHFKQVTSLSPLQFQKHLRLQEARQLLMGGAIDAASAAFQVGYEDPSQFNREYKRMFGVPPIRDVKILRSH